MNRYVSDGVFGAKSIFLPGSTGEIWINIFGFVTVMLLLLPNIIYAIKFRGGKNKCRNKVMNIIEQIGRYTTLFLMIFNIGILEFGFSSSKTLVIYFVGNNMLLMAYWIIWLLYFKEIVLWKGMALAIIPTAIFLLNGITLRHYLLVISAIVFGIGHIYVTYQNLRTIES